MSSLSLAAILALSPVWVQLRTGLTDPPAAGAHVVWVDQQSGKVGVDDDEDADHTIHFIAGAQPQAGGPWLGIAFGPVSKALASQLKLDSASGQVVTNVVEGSPADTAGLQQYDIITAIDGQNVSSKIDDFMAIVKAYKPGETHSLSLLRGGQRVSASLTVGARPAEIGPSKYKNEDEELLGDRVFSRGGMLQKDDKGNWVFKGLNQPGLPDFWKMIPDLKDTDFNLKVPSGGPGSNIQLFISKDDGQSTRVEKADDGKITVTTTTKENGKESTTTRTYNSEDELKAADPEAAKLLAGGPHVGFKFFGDGQMQFQALDDDMKQKLHEAMKNAHGAMGDYSVLMKQLDAMPGGKTGFAVERKARTSFETTADGKVRVTTRRAGEELVTVYDNADALRTAQPELYKKYQRLQDAQGSAPKN